MSTDRPLKRQRTDPGYSAGYRVAPVPPTAHHAPIHPDHLWTTICSMPEATTREILWLASTGCMTNSQMQLRLSEIHYQRIDAEDKAVAKARKAEDARIKREKKRVVSFERDVHQIEDWLDDEHPNYFEKRKSTASENFCWRKLLPRIEKIKEKGTAETANLETKCNALYALIRIAQALFVNSRGAIGCNVIGVFEQEEENDVLSEAMFAILVTMSQDEATRAVSKDCGGAPLGLKITRVWSMCMNGKDWRPFQGLKNVMEGMGINVADPIPNADNPDYPIIPPTITKNSRGEICYTDNSL